MFKVSLEWLKSILNVDISLERILEILNLQGFEVKTVEDVNNDNVMTIEVKANRPDMLSHLGVAREIASFLGKNLDDFEKSNFNSCDIFGDSGEDKSFPVKIKIKNGTCERFSAVAVSGIDNGVPVPEFIKRRLETLGINSINAVVDVSNYIMLESGQPTHIYDIDKLSSKEIFIEKAENKESFLTLAGKNFEVMSGDITIKDNDGIICMAGIIGSRRIETDNNSRDIIIESAVFEKIAIRVTSKRSGISTPASFRFERGVNAQDSLAMAKNLAQRIIEMCGGKICGIFDYREREFENKKIKMRVPRTNAVLGTNLSQNEMIKLLNKYSFNCKPDGTNTVIAEVPSFRLDIKEEIDLIEEVARSIGYDNIEPKNLVIETIYRENKAYSAADCAREILSGLGFNEVITYSFIPENSAEILGPAIKNIKKTNFENSLVYLKNPISNLYSLMRPSLAFSLVQTAAYNCAAGNPDLSLFELGRIYFKNNNFDTGCEESDVLGIIISGNKTESGWGINQNIKLDFYDLNGIIKILYKEFGQNFEILPGDYPFLAAEAVYEENDICNGFKINADGEYAGFLGEINKKVFSNLVPNIKLIKCPMFYGEILVKSLKENKKVLKFESKFPSVVRLYNLVCSKKILAKEIKKTIQNSADFIRDIVIKDIYDKDTTENLRSILFQVTYREPDRTLTAEEIESTEKKFLGSLKNDFEIFIKS
jgi:phenylalanyl-tRNA synthetase beta chain